MPGIVVVAAAVVAASVLVSARDARADVAFRKKTLAANDTTATEASSSGGEPGGEVEGATDTDAPPPPAKTQYVPQAEDKDKPRDPSLLDQTPAEGQLAAKGKAKPKDTGPPFYQKWQFWAITGGVVIGVVGAVLGGRALWHQMQGGDIQACNPMTFTAGCYGQGR